MPASRASARKLCHRENLLLALGEHFRRLVLSDKSLAPLCFTLAPDEFDLERWRS